MENLVLLGERRRRLNFSSTSEYESLAKESTIVDVCTVYAEDLEAESSTIVLTKNGLISRANTNGDILWITNLEQQFDIGGGWFNVSYIDPEVVCLSKRGAIVTLNPTTGEADLVGVFDQGLEAASWSPDGEILLMVTSTEDDDDDDNDDDTAENNHTDVIRKPAAFNSRLMTMNAQFEVLVEVTIPRYIPSSVSPDSTISVAWRPDGSLCAVSSVDEEDGTRNIRIYKRETLEFHAIGRSEDASGALVKNLQSAAISWASAGCSQILAGVQRKGKKTHQVVFFEPNGLRHREFILREDPTTEALSLTWNSTSDLLALSLREQEKTDKIQLWHRCNYHWYLKREFRYPGLQIECVKFNAENPYEFTLILHGLEWREYEVAWDPSTTISIQENCTACVVDGSSLNLTAFNKALIPPPMFATSHDMEFPINDISFCSDNYIKTFILVTMSNGELVLLSDKIGSEHGLQYIKVSWSNLKGIDPLSLRSFLAIAIENDMMRLVAIMRPDCNGTSETLIEVCIEAIGREQPKAFVVNMHVLEGQVLRMAKWMDTNGGCLLQLRNRSLFEYEMSSSGGTISHSDTEPLMEACPWIACLKNTSTYSNSSSHHDGMRPPRLVFGLSARSRLYFEDVMLADSVSSFMVTLNHEFLCYVTAGSRCHLRFLPLSEIHQFDPLLGMDQNHVLEGYEPRNVEQGSKLVAILPRQPQTILQMPRGNLEGICPRALVLQYVMTKILEGCYGEAFRIMRKHKVDLNLIVDLDPLGFLETGVPEFIKQVDAIDYLNLFISNLQNSDVTQARFPVPSWFRNARKMVETSSFDYSTKVNQVCKQARTVMTSMENRGEKSDRYFLLPILSTFAKEDPPKLDEALKLVKDNAIKQHPGGSSKNPLFSENAQHSIHYLAFLAEYELLFETALGMYDFDIARAVARNSQMDPKVYLPLLKRYNTLPTYYSRYEVDMRLKRYVSAFENLYQSYTREEIIAADNPGQNSGYTIGNSFEDCISLINKHKLHKVGLQLFQDDVEKKRVIFVDLGDSLIEQDNPMAALAAYMSVDPPYLDGAKRAARAAGEWKQFFSMLETENGSAVEFMVEKRRQAAREIAHEITQSTYTSEAQRRAYCNAARILLDYGDDLIGSIDYLISAENWSEAYRVAKLHARQDLTKKCIDGAAAFAHTSIDSFAERVVDFEKANNRFAEALKLRKQNIVKDGPEPALEEAETGSLFSAASAASNMSLRSNTSTTSTGSSVSSVISIKTATTFTMTGREESERHRSKFHKGKKQKQRRKKRKPRQLPGSEEELMELVGSMKLSCPDSYYANNISDTIDFLIFTQQLSLAEEVFRAYTQMCNAIEKSRLKRIQTTMQEKSEAERISRLEGDQHDMNYLLFDHPVEKEVNNLTCAQLASSISDFIGFIITESPK